MNNDQVFKAQKDEFSESSSNKAIGNNRYRRIIIRDRTHYELARLVAIRTRINRHDSVTRLKNSENKLRISFVNTSEEDS